MNADDIAFENWLESYEEWLAFSSSERKRLCHVATTRHEQRLRSMTFAQEFAYRRSTVLGTCMRYRRLRLQFDAPVFSANLREAQVDLLLLRDWRRTGRKPGRA